MKFIIYVQTILHLLPFTLTFLVIVYITIPPSGIHWIPSFFFFFFFWVWFGFWFLVLSGMFITIYSNVFSYFVSIILIIYLITEVIDLSWNCTFPQLFPYCFFWAMIFALFTCISSASGMVPDCCRFLIDREWIMKQIIAWIKPIMLEESEAF